MTAKKVLFICLLLVIIAMLLYVYFVNYSYKQELDSWIGNYDFYEFSEPNMNMVYHIEIYKHMEKYFASINIDGFQTMGRIKADVIGNTKSIKLIFNSYLADNVSELYQKGDALLLLRKGDKLLTSWLEMKPMLSENEGSNKVQFESTNSHLSH